jgi:hypothetical protein
MQKCLEVLQQVMSMPQATPFSQPVRCCTALLSVWNFQSRSVDPAALFAATTRCSGQ